MTLSIAILFGIIGLMVLMLVLELISADTIAFLVMVSLIVCGFVTPEEGISGLSNSAAVTVLALMILTVGLESTGVINAMGERMKPLFKEKQWFTIFVIMLIVGIFSGFIATTAVVIVFLRISVKLSEKMPANLSKILMPLSFAGILGGSCTLMGTSTNLLVSSIAVNYGMKPFGIFEFSMLGIAFFIAGLAYMLLVGRFLIPNRKKEQGWSKRQAVQDYLTEIQVLKGSKLIGKTLIETNLFEGEEMDIFEIQRGHEFSFYPSKKDVIEEKDVLVIRGSVEKVTQLRTEQNIKFLTCAFGFEDKDNREAETNLVEVIVRPNSRLLGKNLDRKTLKRTFSAVPLAVRKRPKYYVKHMTEIRIEPGDTVLMEVRKDNFERFYNSPEFIVLKEYEIVANKAGKRYLAAGIVAAVILLAAFKISPIMVAALAGCAAMLITRCLEFQTAYNRVDWSVYILLAGVIPLGIAMDNTGASQLIADTFLQYFGEVSPRMVVCMLFLLTSFLSTVISNNATAILLAPIAITIAQNLQLDPRPLLFTVMFAANTSYASPIGYQTNTLVYGPGAYRFRDFFVVGGLLSLLIWGLATWLIPLLYF